MRESARNSYAVVACAVALAVGSAGPGAVAAESGGRGVVPPAVGGKAVGKGGGGHTVTLITGDRVRVDARGRVGGIERAEGRADVPFFTEVEDGRTYVVPRDARRLIADGTLDRRLFDVTELGKPENRAAYRGGLKVIVEYRGAAAATARAGVRGAEGTTVRRSLPVLNADALTSADGGTGELWDALTRPGRGGAAAMTSGISRIWLDGLRKATLDRSTGQIGAPAAWNRSYDGTGVKIAVLDTGIDSAHPDLAGRVVAERNFSGSPDARDRVGHGTHVASIAAGAGVKDSRFKGVAPGARLINAKVLDDRGEGHDSAVLAGIDWAVAQGADIVNMSLGGFDFPGIDPLEAQVNKVSAEKGVLFAIAAGNEGLRGGRVGSPGSADAALTVGAVDDNDVLADFSSPGPRNWDNAVKPDVSAPGVGITAAAATGVGGQNPSGYLPQDGTSMAAPHAAGAAAILKQKNPGWTGERLKAALMASAKGGAHTVFQQGTGRIQVDRAIDQTVIAEPASVQLGVQQWPHHDDTPVTKRITYRNTGTTDLTLDLSLASPIGSDGQPAPAGFFTLGAQRVTVPAGGTAAVELTADTRLGGTVHDSYSTTVVATGGGQTVRTAATVDREVESYDVTFETLGRDGAPAHGWQAHLAGYAGVAEGRRVIPDLSSGSVTVRVPRGTYALSADRLVDPANPRGGMDLIDNPQFSVTGPATVRLDARTTRPVTITVPDPAARQTRAGMSYSFDPAGVGRVIEFGSLENVRTAYQGPRLPQGSLHQTWSASWERGGDEYHVLTGGPVTELATGFTKSYGVGDLALVKAGIGASAPGVDGVLSASGALPHGSGVVGPFRKRPAPETRNVHLSTDSGAVWFLEAGALSAPDAQGDRYFDAMYYVPERAYTAGTTYTEEINTGVSGPSLAGDTGIVRDGDTVRGTLALVTDGAGHGGWARYTGARTTIHRDGVPYAQEDVAFDAKAFTLAPESARYTVATTVHRDPVVNRAGTRIDASWTFTSARTTVPTALPVSMVRFQPRTALDSTVPAGSRQTFPVEVQGAAAGAGLKSLKVRVSYDAKKWQEVPVEAGKITVRAPDAGKAVSLKAIVVDKQGNKSTVVIHNAFLGK
ncbi:S8 family serine peptidase [Streptomyces sp. NPDC020875]|uniref:S8 family serine peptidase n=1 Tax=Streptomyces sp. NPDC020875 TaxID=3154898 RepID=UPI003407148D